MVSLARHRVAVAAEGGKLPPNCESVSIEMAEPLDGRIGVSIQGGRRKVTRLTHKDAFDAGWRLGDVILEVNGKATPDNEAVKSAVKGALDAHSKTGSGMSFKVQRQVIPVDRSRGMVKMTPGTGGELTVTMTVLLQSLMWESPVVVFLDGTIQKPEANLSAKAVELLNAAGVAYKAVNAADEKFNPGVREAIEKMTGDTSLPQVFLKGGLLGNGYRLEELSESGELESLLKQAGVPSLVD